jgi:glycine dehydrogenase subunit 1
VINTAQEQQAMLTQIGVSTIADLFKPIPAEVQLNRPLDLPEPLAEMELTRTVQQLVARNRSAEDTVCFLGGGAYDHFIPAVVDAISGRSEFYTAYTPYQAEASQGSLQAFYEFQTLVCQLTGMDLANASLYEGGSSVAEAVLMAMNVTGRTGKVLVAGSVHPEYRRTLATLVANLEPTIETLPTPDGYLDPDDLKARIDDTTCAVVVQHPNFFGCLEEVEALAAATHARGALFVVSFDPISLGLLKRPGQYDADIAIAEGQCLGNPLAYGGPYLGLLACRKEYLRKMPGRLVGETVDRHGQRCWVLTLQTREQHIRREKATSNICTNQGLYALRSAVYLAALGPQGLRQTAELCLHKAHYAAEQLGRIPGVSLRFDRPFFKEFTVQLPASEVVPDILSRLLEVGYHAGLHLGRWDASLDRCLSVAVTEKRNKAEIDGLAFALAKVLAHPANNGSNGTHVNELTVVLESK